MLKYTKVQANQKKRRYSNISKNLTKYQQKQNCESQFLLPTLSIKQLKINERNGKNKTQAKDWHINNIIKDAKMSTMKPNLEYTLSYEDKRKTPISQNDSFSVKKYLNNEKRSLRLTVNKNRLLPPLNNLNLSLQSNPVVSPKNLRSQEFSSHKYIKKQRLKTDCKIILQKNNLFPFYKRDRSKSAKSYVQNNQRKQKDNKQYKQNLKLCFKQENKQNQKTQNRQLFNMSENISQIILKQPQKFISKQSIKEIPIF